jgi:hypothetical protein
VNVARVFDNFVAAPKGRARKGLADAAAVPNKGRARPAVWHLGMSSERDVSGVYQRVNSRSGRNTLSDMG